MPTLLEIGKIVPQKWMTGREKKLAKTMPAIEYILDMISDRISLGHKTPKIKIKSPGDKVIILKSGTGSGKSTVLPPALYERFGGKTRGKICVTQPRILTAMDIPETVVKFNPKLILGENIGYRTGPMKKTVRKGILYMTIGSLLAEMKTKPIDKLLKSYSFILIDEVHERDLNVDNVLYHLKMLLAEEYDNPDCPLIILMSATFDPERFMKYYGIKKTNYVEVMGRTFPIESHYSKYDVSDYISYAVDKVIQINTENVSDKKYRDILIFVQGGKSTKSILEKLHKYNAGLTENFIAPITLNGTNYKKGGYEYNMLFSKIENYKIPIIVKGKIIRHVKANRKVIVSTNVAETGVTIDSLKYCIDTGFVMSSEYNPVIGARLLLDKPISRGAADQRRGRVGRVSPGVWYGCYTEATYNSMDKIRLPDIIKENIASELLSILIGITGTRLDFAMIDDGFQMNNIDQNWYKLVSQKIFLTTKLDFLQMPPADLLSDAIKKLWSLGFINDRLECTEFGWYANKFSKIPLESIRMIMAGYHNGADILTLITIAVCVYVGNFGFGIFKHKYTPRNVLNLDNESKLYNEKFFADDFIEYLFIFNEYTEMLDSVGKVINIDQSSIDQINKWMKDKKYKMAGFTDAVKLRDEIIAQMLEMGLNPFYNGLNMKRHTYNLVNILRTNIVMGLGEVVKIKKCIYDGYRNNLAIYNKKLNSYVMQQTNTKINVESSIVSSKPKKIIVSGILIKQNFFAPGTYNANATDVSVMDKFVDIDTSI